MVGLCPTNDISLTDPYVELGPLRTEHAYAQYWMTSVTAGLLFLDATHDFLNKKCSGPLGTLTEGTRSIISISVPIEID